MTPTVRETKPLEGFTLFNPATGCYEVPRLTMEMDPVSKCILDLRMDFENPTDGKGGSHDHDQESP